MTLPSKKKTCLVHKEFGDMRSFKEKKRLEILPSLTGRHTILTNTNPYLARRFADVQLNNKELISANKCTL
jgi:hypothetical protein